MFLDLPYSIRDACQHFIDCEETYDEKAFWMQFRETSGPPLLSDQVKQLSELQQAAKSALEGVCEVLWPNSPLPTSFFELVQRLRSATARTELWKRSACMEGAREAFAAVQTWWPRLDLELIS